MAQRSVRPTGIPGLLVVDMKGVSDERGTVREFFRSSDWGEPLRPWRQVNVTTSRRGAVRGLHGEPMTKLVGLAAGEAFGAYVDARPGPTFGVVESVHLQLGREVLVPQGVCNGFQALSETCTYLYCFDEEWEPAMPGAVGLNPFDPDLEIAWPLPVDPLDPALVSEKDRSAPNLRDLVVGDQVARRKG